MLTVSVVFAFLRLSFAPPRGQFGNEELLDVGEDLFAHHDGTHLYGEFDEAAGRVTLVVTSR